MSFGRGADRRPVAVLPGPVLGLPELDGELAPCLPKGWLALLIGQSDTETSLFAKQFAHQASEAAPALYYTTYERSEDVAATFQGLGWEAKAVRILNLQEEYFRHVLSRRLEVSRVREKGLTLSDLSSPAEPRPPTRSYNLGNRIVSEIAQLDRPFRLVVDSLDFLLEVLDLAEVMTVARQSRHRAQRFGGQALLVVHGEIHERRVSGLLEDMADIVVELTTVPAGDRFEHRLAVRKVRNHPEQKRTAVLRIGAHGFELGAERPG